MLDGIKIKNLKRFIDERGFFNEVYRKDFLEIFEDDIVQANMSFTYPGIIRAWHKHIRGQIDYFYVIKGSIKLCGYDEITKELDEFVLSGDIPEIVRMPGKYWHGFKVLGTESVILLYFVNRLYDYSDPDEIRRPWNDPAVVPQLINGNKEDIRVGKSWDWNLSPNK